MDKEVEELVTDSTPVTNDETSVPDGAQSSGANDEPASLMDVVRDVVNKTEQPEGDAASSPASEAEKDQAPVDPDNEEYKDVPFHAHPRFQQVIRQNRELKGDAMRFREVQNFMRNNGLGPDEVSNGLVIMGLMKTNPVEAWKQLAPVALQLAKAAGEILPPELEASVKNGTMSVENALAISRSSALAGSAKVYTTHRDRQIEEQNVTARVNTTIEAVNEWERSTAARDPDYALKKELVQQYLVAENSRNQYPTTPDEAVKRAQEAYKKANDYLKRVRPAQVEKRSIGDVSLTGAAQTTKPRSLREAAERALTATRRA